VLKKVSAKKTHKPKPKRANGLHFVWGAIFLLEGGLSPPKHMPGYVPVSRHLVMSLCALV